MAMDNPYARWAQPQQQTPMMPAANPAADIPDNPYARWASPGGDTGLQQASDTSGTNSEQSPSWSELPGNIPGSAYEAGAGLYQTVRHPIDTATALYNAGPSGIANYFIDRYGSAENAKKTFIKDPVGSLLDLSTFISGPEGAAVRLAGSASKIGRVATKAGEIGRTVDPMAAAAKTGGALAQGAGKLSAAALGGTTGAGSGLAIKSAAKAGFEGGESAKTFRANITGKADPEEAARLAQAAASNARRDLSAHYHTQLNSTLKDVAIPRAASALNAVDKAIEDAAGAIGYSPSGSGLPALKLSATEPVVAKLKAAVDKFRSAGPAYRTIGGFDLLKRDLNKIRKGTALGSEERNVANQAYYAARNTITNVHPEYAKLMGEYREGKGLIDNLAKTFSLQGTPDTILRKLGSTMRSGVFTNFNARAKALDFFAKHGGDQVVNMVAGQTLHPIFRAGLVAQLGLLGAAGGAMHFVSPMAPVALAAFSPRLIGNAAFRSGQVAKLVVHPLLATERAMRAVGITAKPLSTTASAAAKLGGKMGVTKRGATLAATQAGKIANHEQQTLAEAQQFKSAVEQQAKALGYSLSPRVINQISYQLLSEDPEAYIKGLHTLGHNKRLLEIITKIGTKGEQ